MFKQRFGAGEHKREAFGGAYRQVRDLLWTAGETRVGDAHERRAIPS